MRPLVDRLDNYFSFEKSSELGVVTVVQRTGDSSVIRGLTKLLQYANPIARSASLACTREQLGYVVGVRSGRNLSIRSEACDVSAAKFGIDLV